MVERQVEMDVFQKWVTQLKIPKMAGEESVSVPTFLLVPTFLPECNN